MARRSRGLAEANTPVLPAPAAAPRLPAPAAKQPTSFAATLLDDNGARVADPFTPQPLDPATVVGTPEEQLAIVLAALQAADANANSSIQATKNRWTIEKGAALKVFVANDMHRTAGYSSVREYAPAELGISGEQVYTLIEDSDRLIKVMAMPKVWKIFHTQPKPSQLRALAPTLALEGGEDKAAEVVQTVQAEGKKVTAAALKATAQRLGYAPVPEAPRPAAQEGPTGEEVNALLAGLVADLTRALGRVEKLPKRYTTAAADQKKATDDRETARRLGRQIASGLQEATE